jgi:hypothetical protein
MEREVGRNRSAEGRICEPDAHPPNVFVRGSIVSRHFSLVQNFEDCACARGIQNETCCWNVSLKRFWIPLLDKIPLSSVPDLAEPECFTLSPQILKIHISGKVLFPRSPIDLHALEPLVLKKSAQRSAPLTSVDFRGGTAVIGREQCAPLQRTRKLFKPRVVTFVNFDNLADRQSER